jgi:hypothetical protein
MSEAISAADLNALRRAVRYLERPSFAARLTRMADNRSTSSARSCPRRVTTIATATTKSLDVTKGHGETLRCGEIRFGPAEEQERISEDC